VSNSSSCANKLGAKRLARLPSAMALADTGAGAGGGGRLGERVKGAGSTGKGPDTEAGTGVSRAGFGIGVRAERRAAGGFDSLVGTGTGMPVEGTGGGNVLGVGVRTGGAAVDTAVVLRAGRGLEVRANISAGPRALARSRGVSPSSSE
jgi:hypothetical protein